MTTPQAGPQLPTQHQGAAHQVPFNLDDAPIDLGPVHVYFNDLGDPYDPAAAEAAPPPAPLIAAAVHDCFGDSASSDDDLTMDDDLSFVKGSATHGDVHDFAYKMLRLIRGGRKAAYRLQDQLQAWAARCDKTTDRAIQTAIASGFRLAADGGGLVAGRWYFTDADAALAQDPVAYAAGLPPVQQATLTLFAEWFKRTFYRVEAVREAKRQVEYDFGQTQSLEHHNAAFNELLEMLPGNNLLATATHIDHYLSSLSELLPAELAEKYDTPRQTVEDEHAGEDNGTGYATLLEVQAAALAAERKVSAAARKLGLSQHWIDFAGRKTSVKGRKGIVGSVEMADAALTQASARSLMAGYADSAANKQAAELRREFGSRIETLETGLSTFSTQLQSVDTKIDRQHSELLQALRGKGKGGQGGKGKWRHQQQPLQPRFQQQQQQQPWQQQPQWQQQRQAPQAGWQATVPAPQRQGAAAGQSWASGRKPLACWGCGGPHMERNCPNKGTVDATRADTRHGANVCSLALSGDDSGEATLEEVEEKFGSLEEVRGFVNAVRAQSEEIMTAAVQQGTHAAHPTAHPAWSRISDSLRSRVENRGPCVMVDSVPSGIVAVSPPQGSIRISNSLTHSPALTAQQTEQRHLYEPLIGAPSEYQVISGTTPTAPLVGTGTTKVSSHPAHTALASLNACDRKSVSSTPNPVSKVNSLSRLRDSTGKLLLASKSRDDSAAVESESHTHPAVRNTALSYPDVDLNTSACVAVDPVDPVNSRLTRALCDLVGVVYRDINCSSSSRSDCIRSAEADLHDPECSSTSAGSAVNAPLNASSALSDTNLAQTHSARHDAQARLSVPNSHSQLQGEYPPCLSSDVLCGDLSPRVSHSCDPLFSESWGKILGLVAAPLVANAVSSPVAESADPSGKDSLVRMGPACHSIASQSSSQPDSQSEAHTAPSSAAGLCEPLDRQKSKRIWRSKFGSDPSCVAARAAFITQPQPTLSFSISISVKPVPIFNWRAP